MRLVGSSVRGVSLSRRQSPYSNRRRRSRAAGRPHLRSVCPAVVARGWCRSTAARCQKMNFSPNWISRAVAAPLIRPNRLLDLFIVGWFKLTLLNTLKNSLRNCSVLLSASRTFLKRDISKLITPGPRMTPFPELPYLPTTGCVKAAASNHCSTCRWPTGKFPSAIRFGLLPARLPRLLETLVVGLKRSPELSVVIPLICQPPSTTVL